MQRQMLKSKIHRATVTDCDLHYAGSITLDPDLMREADLLASELVHVLDIDNGNRFETYVIEGRSGSREVQVNGAAARLVQRGDRVIIISYATYAEDELARHAPRVVHVDADNEVVRVDADPAAVV
jgi:aspartate 1-decarboxylase